MKRTDGIVPVRGISVLNPTDIEEKYLLRTVEYAREHNYNHLEIVGAIHNYRRGNLDGMTYYRKYARYNGEKDAEYIDMCTVAVNRALELAEKYGIKVYVWHHELDLPTDFSTDFPDALNVNGDIELSHPLVKDFLQSKISDFFVQYPKVSGIILTLHETKIPLLKLKNQVLDKRERVKYVVGILYDVCRAYGKELIVRPFSSLAEDTEMMLRATESVSPDIVIMEKWTQFDWPITLPPNSSLGRIKNPLIVETDISCEYLGKGRIPVMFERHIKERFEFCDRFSPVGYVHRIDRNGQLLLDTVNEVNLEITNACMRKDDTEAAIAAFFEREYPTVAKELKELMEPTQLIAEKLLHNKGYYFMQGSYFPCLNHSKNHYYFEMMRKCCDIVSDEWFIPKAFRIDSTDELIAEKEEALALAEGLLKRLSALEGRLPEEKYKGLFLRFANLYYAARIWLELVRIFISYVKYFETGDSRYEAELYEQLAELDRLDDEGRAAVNDKDYYCNFGYYSTHPPCKIVKEFIPEIKESFVAEKRKFSQLSGEALVDFVVCGGGLEGHKLKKEVNFSDTLIHHGEPCRIPGNSGGKRWSHINAHGWFSYEIRLIPDSENEITLELGSLGERLALKVTVGNKELEINKPCGEKELFKFKYTAAPDEGSVRIRFDRICEHTPLVYSIRVK